jgi:hypothetical protein
MTISPPRRTFAIFGKQHAELALNRCVFASGADVDRTRMKEWTEWRNGVVAEIRREFREHFSSIEDHDIDWDAWMPLFLEGCPPRLAVDKAFVRYN